MSENSSKLGKVPELTFLFWIIKIAATTLGETGGDAVSMSLDLGFIALPFLLAKKIGRTNKGDLDLTANLGYNISNKTDVPNFISAAIGIGAPLARRIAGMGELTTQQSVSSNAEGIRNQLVKVNFGLMGIVTKQLWLYGSFGSSIFSSDQLSHTYFTTGIRILTE